MEIIAAEGLGRSRLADLYSAYAPRAVRLAYLLTSDAAAAEEIVQEAFVRIASKLGHLRDPSAFERYLRRTVVNLSRSRGRRLARERKYLEREAAQATVQSLTEPDFAIRDQLFRALKLLPERQRAAVVLRYFEDLSEHQIAEALDCPLGTAKSLLSRGIQALRVSLEGEEDDG